MFGTFPKVSPVPPDSRGGRRFGVNAAQCNRDAPVIKARSLVLLERHINDPFVPPVLFSYTNFLGASVASAIMMSTGGGSYFLLTLFM